MLAVNGTVVGSVMWTILRAGDRRRVRSAQPPVYHMLVLQEATGGASLELLARPHRLPEPAEADRNREPLNT